MSDNELIAEFVGETDDVIGPGGPYQYDKFWDVLMPVVEKIRKYVIEECPFGNEYYDALCIALIEVNIHDCHFEVVEFIKWYNKNK